MTEMKIVEINLENDTIIERVLTPSEIKQKETDAEMLKERQLNAKKKDEAKTALLAKLGITVEEAALLLS
jgi:hypothetical protein